MDESLREVWQELSERKPEGSGLSPVKDPTPEQIELEGPQSRRWELGFVFRVGFEFLRGFRKLHFVGPCVTVFGSARLSEGHEYYEMARRVGRELTGLGFTVMTGGGPGIMEAANRGAKEAGGTSVGCNIQLPEEQGHNQYLDHWVTFEYFFVRKVLLFKYSYAFVAMPGGVGTMDELFEAITLVQTEKIRDFPVVLMGTDYWRPLVEFLGTMAEEGTISPSDLDLILVTDDVEEAMNHIRVHAIEQFELSREHRPEPHRWLGEHANGQMPRKESKSDSGETEDNYGTDNSP